MHTSHHNDVRRALGLRPDDGGVQPPIPTEVVDMVEWAEKTMVKACNRSGYSRGELLLMLVADYRCRMLENRLKAAGLLGGGDAEGPAGEDVDLRSAKELREEVSALGVFPARDVQRASRARLQEMLAEAAALKG
jgi:hypothetical protein